MNKKDDWFADVLSSTGEAVPFDDVHRLEWKFLRACAELNRLAQEKAEALDALRKIAAIKDRHDGGDWDEIEEARLIARDAIYAVTGEETRYTVTPAGKAALRGEG